MNNNITINEENINAVVTALTDGAYDAKALVSELNAIRADMALWFINSSQYDGQRHVCTEHLEVLSQIIDPITSKM